ncbi:3TM-type holin [Acanthopleuribacter pedis]|uniref:Holin of 3TMs, for gene-transfer release n=1 Tax=Acanthopleuribacter pedis TaxID=442870 RepID=A0A8J7Q3L9_9BACT|nr:3TM-type holin [Acanthopleuribacter pedis]MBO1317739.1 hypothetical protein [Acanthopleuribacter pedis]
MTSFNLSGFPDITALVKEAGGIIDQFVTSDDERAEAKAKLLQLENQLAGNIMAYETQLAQQRGTIIAAEARSQSWLTRNWRPLLMLSITAILIHKYLLYPYLILIFGSEVAPRLELTPELFNLLTIGVGGYVVGRSGEKIVGTLRDSQTRNSLLPSEDRAARRALRARGRQMRRLSRLAEKQGWSDEELDRRLDQLLDTEPS